MAFFFAGWLRNPAFPFDTHTGLCYTICKLKSVHVYIICKSAGRQCRCQKGIRIVVFICGSTDKFSHPSLLICANLGDFILSALPWRSFLTVKFVFTVSLYDKSSKEGRKGVNRDGTEWTSGSYITGALYAPPWYHGKLGAWIHAYQGRLFYPISMCCHWIIPRLRFDQVGGVVVYI